MLSGVVAEEPWVGNAPSWNKEDDDGHLVPSGIYSIRWRCLDSTNPFTFDGHFYVWGSREQESCDWLIWSDVVDLSDGRTRVEFWRRSDALRVRSDHSLQCVPHESELVS